MTPSPGPARLSRLWPALVRAAWVVLASGLLGLFVLSLPQAYQRLAGLSYSPYQVGSVTVTSESQQAAMRLLRLSAGGYALYQLGLSLLTTSVWSGIAALIVWRRPRDWFAWFASILLLLGVDSTPIHLAALVPGAGWLMEAINNVRWPLLFVFGYLFPNGRFVPGWMRWPAVVLAVAAPALASLALTGWLGTLSSLALTLFAVGSLGAQVYRYWRVSNTVERQQTKWVVLSLVLFWLLGLVPLFGLGINHPLYFDANSIVGLIFPAGLGVAILRYRLWDLDLLIRRTLVYSVLTGLLALAYFGLIVVLESLLRSVTGRSQNQFVIVVSTLAIAALFGPLRARVQSFIDRRFYRRKYNAARTLAAFGATLRDEVELDQLTEHLVRAVIDTMQPASMGLWLRPVSTDAIGPTDQRIGSYIAPGSASSVDPLPHPVTPLTPSGRSLR